MPRIKAVLFDLDGTLCETGPYILNAFNHALRSEGFSEIGEEEIAVHAGIPLDVVYRRIAPAGHVKKLCELHRAFQAEHMSMVYGYPGLKEMLGQLKKLKIKMAIVTGRYGLSTQKILQHLGITGYFPVVMTSDEEHEPKPHPAPFLKAAKLLEVKPSECLVVGDGASDMESGRKAGCLVARALYGYGSTEPTLHKPDFELRKLSEVVKLVQTGSQTNV